MLGNEWIAAVLATPAYHACRLTPQLDGLCFGLLKFLDGPAFQPNVLGFFAMSIFWLDVAVAACWACGTLDLVSLMMHIEDLGTGSLLNPSREPSVVTD